MLYLRVSRKRGGFFTSITNVIVKVLEVFHLYLAVTYFSLCLFIELLTGVISTNETVKIVFWSLGGLTLLFALVMTIRDVFGLKRQDEKKKDNPTVQLVEEEPPKIVKEAIKITKEAAEKPSYFRVRQNPSYIMAEYPDRYELFYDSPSGLKYIRTDYKEKQW